MELPEDIQLACLLGPGLLSQDDALLFEGDWEPEPQRPEHGGDLVDGCSWTMAAAPALLLPRLTSVESATTGMQQHQQARASTGGLWPGAELTGAGAAAALEACLSGPAWLPGDSSGIGHGAAQELPGLSLAPAAAAAAAATESDDSDAAASGATRVPAPTSAAAQPCESCWEAMLEGDELHKKLLAGNRGTKMAELAGNVLSRAVWGCERVQAASSSGSSGSSSNPRPCLIDGQLQHGKDWQLTWTKARDAPPGQQRAPDGTEWARDYNIAVNAPMPVLCGWGRGASSSSSSEGGSSGNSGSDAGRQLYCIRARSSSSALTAYTLARQAAGGGDAAGSSEGDSVWSHAFTCRKKNSPLCDQQLQPLKYAFLSKDSSTKGDGSAKRDGSQGDGSKGGDSPPKKKKQKKD